MVAEAPLAGDAGDILDGQQRRTAGADEDAEILTIDGDLEIISVLVQGTGAGKTECSDEPVEEGHGLLSDSLWIDGIADGPWFTLLTRFALFAW